MSKISHVVPSNESMPEPGEDMEPVTRSPKSSLNLAGLKAAFSSHHSSNSGNKSNGAKAANSGPTQKTLQSFFKDPVKPPSVTSPLKPARDIRSPVGKSALDGFRYGKMLGGDADSEKESALSSCDVNTATPDSQCSKPDAETPSVKNETFEEMSDNSDTVPEDPELQTEPRTSNEDSCTMSPDAKRPRTEKPHLPAEHKSKTFSTSSSMVDAPVCLQKRTVPLQFSIQELVGKMKRLQDLQKQRDGEDLRYRRFRAKINPGENQSAEEELKKEIRWEFTPITTAD